MDPKKPTMISILLGMVFMACLLSCNRTGVNSTGDTYVVMLSMDGFRWDYAQMYDTPNLDKLEERGTKAVSLIPSFPTKTFPNHYTIATGLYPDHHGIVLNSFYDPGMNAYYSLYDRESVQNGAFYGGEPIWVTAEKQGVRTASYFWVGSEAPVEGIRPSIWKEYNQNVPFEARVDSVIAWLRLPEDLRPRLITFYFHEPDSKGHRSGPGGPELGRTIEYLDSLVGDLATRLDKLEIADRIDLIVTSDHGMGPASPSRYTDLADYLKPGWIDVIQGYNPNYVVMAADGFYDSILTQLDKIPHVSGWISDSLPQRLAYGSNPRTLDFVFLADSAWSVGWQENADTSTYGAHGYDNMNRDMHTIFYAAGPDFKAGYSQPSFQNIHIYPLLAHILELVPADTDGDLEQVKSMLRDVK